jgi:prolyl 4-hydroxylase
MGHRVYLESTQSPTGQPIILESWTGTCSRYIFVEHILYHPVPLETPRVFHIYNFFSHEEADQLIARVNASNASDTNVLQLERSLTGSAEAKKVSRHRTSENVFDTKSEIAMAFKKRSFDLLTLGAYDPNLGDGIQILRYQQKQAYIPHHDYFPIKTSSDFNYDSHTGGSNRFATIFLYLSNVTLGGQTVFPHVNMPEGFRHPQDQVDALKTTGPQLFDRDSWELETAEKCTTQ